MSTAVKILSFLILLFLWMEGSLLSETLRGRIVSVEDQKTLKILSAGKYAYLPKYVHLILNPRARLHGVESLEELAGGEDIVVEAQRRGSKTWEVFRLKREGASESSKT